MTNIALLLTGFSLFYAIVFTSTHFRHEHYSEQKIAHIFGIILMLCLSSLQLSHYYYLNYDNNFIHSKLYLFVLFMVAPSFYFYARPVLKAENNFKPFHLLHFTPFIFLFLKYEWAFALAFIIGSAYLLWLLKTIFALKNHQDTFKHEIILLSVVFIVAISTAVLALIKPIEEHLFFSFYATAIGIALFMVALVISFTPKISENISEIAKETYAVSTLTAINCEEKLILLERMMQEDNLYQENNLDLHTVATQLNLTTHQVSELINSNLGKSFSRYLRELRIKKAKELLTLNKNESVLTVGLGVGFSTQSNFYKAFKEIEGTTPGKYRKLHVIKSIE